MAKVDVTIETVVQNTQQLGGDDEHMFSEVLGTIEFKKQRFPFKATLKQAVGDAGPGAIEVSAPAGYSGPFDQATFANEIRNLYATRVVVTSGRPSRQMLAMMRNNTFGGINHHFALEAPEQSGNPW